jgi:hypothetical protein
MSDVSERDAMLAVIAKAKQRLAAQQAAGNATVHAPVLSHTVVPQSVAEEADRELAREAQLRSSAVESVTACTGTADPQVKVSSLRTYITAKENRSDFFNTWSRRIEAFIADSKATKLEFPAELTSNDRRELHSLAEKYNLEHHSEGFGGERRLFLTKDKLHFAAPEMRPDLDAMKAARKKRAEVVYADADAEKRYRKFNAATNAEARAVETGYTFEEIMNRGRLQEEGQNASTAGRSNATGVSGDWQRVLQQQQSSAGSTAAGAQKKFVETCTQCGTSNPFNHDASKWDCNGFCPICKKDTIWVLEVQVGSSGATQRVGQKRNRDEEANDGNAAVGKKARDDTAATEVPPLSKEDAVELAKLNEMVDANIDWISRYCDCFPSAAEIGKHLWFVLDFSESAFPSHGSVVELSEIRDSDRVLADGLDELFAALASDTKEEVQRRSTVAFPATAMFGEPCHCLVHVAESSERVTSALSGVKACRITLKRGPVTAL